MAAKALLTKILTQRKQKFARAFPASCAATGYKQIVDAVKAAAGEEG